MEYGQIFHVMRIGKYYCKNMKDRIKKYISHCSYSLKKKLTLPFMSLIQVMQLVHIILSVLHKLKSLLDRFLVKESLIFLAMLLIPYIRLYNVTLSSQNSTKI